MNSSLHRQLPRRQRTADSQVAIVGSANMGIQSRDHSHEVNLVVDSAETTQSWDVQPFASAGTRAIPGQIGARGPTPQKEAARHP